MSSPATLVSWSDVEVRLPSGINVDVSRANQLIRDASAVVRSFTKQTFTVTTTTDKVRPIGYKIRLVKKPVRDVTQLSVVMTEGQPPVPFVGWWWDGSDEVWLTRGDDIIINLAEEIAALMRYQTPIVFVTYEYGYDEVPDDVIAVVCSMVARTITTPNQGGVISENVGEYGYRLSNTAAQGVIALTDAEKQVLKQYQPKNKSAIELR